MGTGAGPPGGAHLPVRCALARQGRVAYSFPMPAAPTCRLVRFATQGYKNLTAEVALDSLGDFNVIVGPNNVGKSNLLEAIALYFRCLASLADTRPGGGGVADRYASPAADPTPTDGRVVVLSAHTMESFGFPIDSVFTLQADTPIHLSATVSVTGAEVHLAVRLERTSNGAVRIHAGRPENGAVDQDVARLCASIGRSTGIQPFSLLRADRNILPRASTTSDEALGADDPESVLALLALDGHDADPGTARRGAWDRFARFLAALDPSASDVSWSPRYDRRRNRAELLCVRPGAPRVPLALEGSGMRQSALVAGHVALRAPSIAAIEEPELNLRVEAQLRLRDALSQSATIEDSRQQIIVTTHAKEFEFGETASYYRMSAPSGVPRVDRVGQHLALAQLSLPGTIATPSDFAPRCFVTREGALRLPPEFMKALGIPNGGGVSVLASDEEGILQLVSDERLSALLDDDDDHREARGKTTNE